MMHEFDDYEKQMLDRADALRVEADSLASEAIARRSRRVARLPPLDQLRFAATARCECGLGMAYKPHADPAATEWVCSGILMGTADVSAAHTEPLVFAFWEVKSEDQPSANGMTTRPK